MALHDHIKAETKRLEAVERQRRTTLERDDKRRYSVIGVAFEKAARDEVGLAAALVNQKPYKVKLEGARRIKSLKDVFGWLQDCYRGPAMGIRKNDIESHPAYKEFQKKLAREGYEVREIDVYAITGAYNVAKMKFGESSLFPSLWK